MLDRVGQGALADRYPNELSGGEQQRVALARALIADTGLILCDEPLSNLDADLRERMRVEISALVREAAATTVYITHDQAEAFALADQVGVLVEPQSGQAFHARAPIGSLAGTLLAGQAALAMIRPTGVKLCTDGSDGHHLAGRVTDVAFRGRGYEHAIDVNGSTRLTGVFADVRSARGEMVRLRLDPAGCHLFPADQ
jgi:iron(III) transport system ATP-binding protein